MFDLAQHIGGLEPDGEESYAGPCPKCGGDDRFGVSPSEGDTGLFNCRQCGFSGDGLDYLQEVEGRTFREACEVAECEWKLRSVTADRTAGHTFQGDAAPPPESVTAQNHTGHTSGDSAPKTPQFPTPKRSEPPPEGWQERAFRLVLAAEDRIRADTQAARSARTYLKGRGFKDETIQAASIGVNPSTRFDDASDWARADDRAVWLPRGIVIPWLHAGHMWGVNIRRPDGDVQPEADEGWKARKYHRATGSRNALYNADELDGRPVALVEGEFDALAIQQESDQVAAVATGSTAWGRAPRWKALLRCAPVVLVCFDAEHAGEQAADYWTDALPNAIRWRPHLHDAAEMLEVGANVARWIEEGLDAAVSAS
jgi:hypothetical protein